MNRNGIIAMLLAVAFGAGGLSFGLARGLKAPPSATTLERMRDAPELVRALDLDASQARQVRALHDALADTLADCCARHCAARDRLGVLLAEGGPADAVDAEITLMARAYEDSERAVSGHIRSVMALLAPAQKERLRELVASSLIGANGMQGCTMPNVLENAQPESGGEPHGNR